MDKKYSVVIFKNKKLRKVLKKFKTKDGANKFYEKKLNESNQIVFDKKIENGKNVYFELALISNEKSEDIIYKSDDLGRNIPVISENENISIKKINPFKIIEKVQKINSQEKLTLIQIVNLYLKGNSIKLISKLNNKIIIQDDDSFILFSCKSTDDADRFISTLEDYLHTNNKKNAILVRDTDIAQKKYLYDMFEKLGYNRDMLYRVSTTHLRQK